MKKTAKIYQEDINNAVAEMLHLVDILKRYNWSSTEESNKIFEKLSTILEEEFNYPEFLHHA